MHFDTVFVLATATLSSAFPKVYPPPLQECSSVDCKTNLDCQEVGYFGYDKATGKCAIDLVSSYTEPQF